MRSFRYRWNQPFGQPTGVKRTEWYLQHELCRELTSIEPDHYVRSQRVKEYPMLTKLNEVSMLDDTTSFTIDRERREENCEWSSGSSASCGEVVI